MGCHTWFYTKSKRQYDYETAKEYMLKSYSREIYILEQFISGSLPDEDIEWSHFENMPIEQAEKDLNTCRRVLRRVQSDTCKDAVMSRFAMYNDLKFSTKTRLFYVETGYHDIFRVSKYPNNMLHSLKETLEFMSTRNDVYTYYDDTNLRLEQFWKEHPEGLIYFG